MGIISTLEFKKEWKEETKEKRWFGESSDLQRNKEEGK